MRLVIGGVCLALLLLSSCARRPEALDVSRWGGWHGVTWSIITNDERITRITGPVERTEYQHDAFHDGILAFGDLREQLPANPPPGLFNPDEKTMVMRGPKGAALVSWRLEETRNRVWRLAELSVRDVTADAELSNRRRAEMIELPDARQKKAALIEAAMIDPAFTKKVGRIQTIRASRTFFRAHPSEKAPQYRRPYCKLYVVGEKGDGAASFVVYNRRGEYISVPLVRQGFHDHVGPPDPDAIPERHDAMVFPIAESGPVPEDLEVIYP